MKIYINSFFSFSFLLLLLSCTNYKEHESNPIKIITIDSVEVEEIGGERRVSEKIRRLCDTLIVNGKDKGEPFIQAIILQPNLNRLDLDKSISLKTTIESVAGDENHPNVLESLIVENLEEKISIGEDFSSKRIISDIDVSNMLLKYLSLNLKKDSLIIYSDSETSFDINGRVYKTYDDVQMIRKKIHNILNKNPKASFTIFWNPIFSKVTPPPPPPEVVYPPEVSKNIIRSKKITKKIILPNNLLDTRTVDGMKNGIINGNDVQQPKKK